MPYSISYTGSVKEAEEAIHENKLTRAVDLYSKLIKRKPTDENNYSRLMMLFRRQKLYSKELQIINEGIKVLSNAYHAKGQKLFANNANVKRISNALLKALGLKSKTGKHLHEPAIVEQWQKRKAIVLKKLANNKILKHD